MYYEERGFLIRGMGTMKRAHAYLDGWLFVHAIANVCTFVACPVRNIAAVRKEPCGSLGMMGPSRKNEGRTRDLPCQYVCLSSGYVDWLLGRGALNG